MKITYKDYLTEICIHPYYVYSAVLLVGFCLIFITPTIGIYQLYDHLHYTILMLYILPLIAYVGTQWSAYVGRIVIIFGLIIIVTLLIKWFDIPGILNLLIIPPLLGSMMLGRGENFLIGILLTSFIFYEHLINPSRYPGTELIIISVIIWVLIIVIQIMHKLMFSLYERSRNYSNYASQYIQEARDSRVKLEQYFEDISYANQLLLQANERAEKLREIAENAKRNKELFVAKVSHEFRTPLNLIIGLIELIVDKSYIYRVKLPAEMKNDLKVVLRNSKHLSDLISDVLDLSQLESGKLVLYRDWIDLSEILNDASKIVDPLIRKKGLLLRTNYPEDLPRVYCDKTRIRQVILNLVSNAVRHTDKGEIHCEIQNVGQHILIKVSDTGLGIDPEMIKDIFEPFYQGSLDPWKAKQGSGLGLSISKQFVEQHGGQLLVESVLGFGSTFSFSLPINPYSNHNQKPENRIVPNWEWREDQFKKAKISAYDIPQKINPIIIVYDSGGYLGEILGKLQMDAQFISVDNFTDVLLGIKNENVEAVLLISNNSSSLLKILHQAKKKINLPLYGVVYADNDTQLKSNKNLIYLTKPIDIGKLSKTLDELTKPINSVTIIDDDLDMVRLLKKMIGVYNPRIELSSALNGQEALQILTAKKPDAIILDIMMPKMDGWELIKTINKNQVLRNTPIVIVSAQDLYKPPQKSPWFMVTQAQGLQLDKIIEYSLQWAIDDQKVTPVPG